MAVSNDGRRKTPVRWTRALASAAGTLVVAAAVVAIRFVIHHPRRIIVRSAKAVQVQLADETCEVRRLECYLIYQVFVGKFQAINDDFFTVVAPPESITFPRYLRIFLIIIRFHLLDCPGFAFF